MQAIHRREWILSGLAWLVLVSTLSAEITVMAPEDGGWPRDPAKITQTGPRSFTVDPAGHNRYLMVEIQNSGREMQTVELRGFINDFGRRGRVVEGQVVNAASPELYLYVQPEGESWRRVYATEVAKEFPFGPWIIETPPGRTRVSTVVPFTYAEYVELVESLPTDPRITKEVVATSGNGRFKTYRIRITNPASTNRHKLKIGLCKTSHAYERAGFFLAQGAIRWLLSGDPAANLDHIEWTIYPCLDPQAMHDGCDYIEQAGLVMDDGRPRGDARNNSGALWDPKTGELSTQRFHVLTDIHMWEFRDFASYKYNDPFAPPGRDGNGRSQVEADLLAFWPYWYEFGIDQFDHENKWPGSNRAVRQNARPEDFGGALVTHLELPFYGFDDIDPRERMAEQGRLWARSHSQAYLRMQRDRRYWTEESPGGMVDVIGARLLAPPKITLLEDLTPASGNARSKLNGNGGPIVLFREPYEHGIGQLSSETVTYDIPADASSLVAMVGIDDSAPSDREAVFAAYVDDHAIFRSRPLTHFERQFVRIALNGGKRLTLRIDCPDRVPGNWGGAKFVARDHELGRPISPHSH